MRGRTLAILLVCGIVALGAGWYASTQRQPDAAAERGGALAFPGLTPKLQAATKVEITHQGRRTVLEKRADGGGGVAEMHDYPVQDAKLRGLLTALTELRLAEPRTSDPAQFARLGVDDPSDKNSTADLLRVLDGADGAIAALIVGHRKVRSRGDLPDQVYVRRPGENQSWLAEGNLQVGADAASWLDRTVMNIAHDRVATVVVGDNALVFGRPAGTFTLVQPEQHPKLEDYKVEDVARALEAFSFQTVRPDSDAAGTETGRAVFTTTDGLAVTATVLHAGNDVKDAWVRFAAAGSGAAKTEADALNARLHGWTYEVGAWKEKSLVPTLDDLKAAEPSPPTAAAPAASPPSTR